MGVDLRSEVFRLRQQDPPVSIRKIAEQLGVSPSRVQRELEKTARDRNTDGGGGSYIPDPIVSGDPALAEQRRALESERLDLQRIDLQTKRLEAVRRQKLLESPDSGNGLVAVLLQELDHMRRDMSALASRTGAPPPATPPAPSLTDQLAQWRQIGETMQSFAPPKAPSSAVELEFKVAMERLNLEERRIAQQLEADARERQERAASQRTRDEAIAKAIEQWAPVLASAAERWLKEPPPKSTTWAPSPQMKAAAGNGSAPPTPVVLHPDEVVGQCPKCGNQLAITPGGDDDRCPSCGQELAVANGVVVARGGRPSNDGPPRFAS